MNPSPRRTLLHLALVYSPVVLYLAVVAAFTATRPNCPTSCSLKT